MTSVNNLQVYNLLLVIIDLINNSTSQFTYMDIGNSLYGLQSMDLGADIVIRLICSLNNKIKENFSNINVPETVISLQLPLPIILNQLHQPIPLRILQTQQIHQQIEQKNIFQVKPLLHIYNNDERIANDLKSENKHPFIDCLYYVRIAAKTAKKESDLRRLYYAIIVVPTQYEDIKVHLIYTQQYILDLLNIHNASTESTDNINKSLQFGLSKSEENIYRALNDALNDYGYVDYEYSVNHILYGFEADIVLRTSNDILINIEVDGPSHNLPSKYRFCQKRDKILKMNNIRVIRIDIKNIESIFNDPTKLRDHMHTLLKCI